MRRLLSALYCHCPVVIFIDILRAHIKICSNYSHNKVNMDMNEEAVRFEQDNCKKKKKKRETYINASNLD